VEPVLLGAAGLAVAAAVDVVQPGVVQRLRSRQLLQLSAETMLRRHPQQEPTTIRNCSFTLYRIEERGDAAEGWFRLWF
jgi:hypothetical protein